MSLHRLNHLVREVPNFDETRAFFRDFGLTEGAPGVFSTQVGGDQLIVREGPVARVVSISIGADEQSDLDAVAERLRALDVEVTTEDGRVHTTEPVTGVGIEIVVAPRLPKEHLPERPPLQRDNLVPREPVRPMRLGHVVLGCTDLEAGERFFIDGIGMRLSDYVIGGPFMRFETDHHNIVLLPAQVNGLHHTAWKVRSVDEIGYAGTELLRRHPECHAWGLGRHAASANYFWYLKDPGGAFIEYYYSEMDEQAETPTFWDPVPDGPDLPVAVWASPPSDYVLIPDGLKPAPESPDRQA